MNIKQLSLAVLCAAGCTGDPGAIGETGATGAGVVASTVDEPAGSNCPTGGVKFTWGVDDNSNGTLDAAEVDGTSYICNGGNGGSGSNGHNTLVATSTEAAGVNCAAGGLKVDHGVDDNNNGTLEAGEIDGTDYVCAPSKNLVATASEPVGTNCPSGGTVITSGLDDNNNGTLEVGEVDDTDYVCNGANGLKSLVRTSFEGPGTSCPAAGGTRIDYGVDDNNNNTLESAEIDGTSYVCDLGQLFDSTPGALYPGVNNRGAGASCGTRVNVGGANVVVRRLSSLTQMGTGGNMKFVIFNHNAADAIVYQSAPKAFVADGAAPSWKYSDALNVTLAANGSYCIAMTADVAGDFKLDIAGETAAGLTSTVNNPNLNGNYASPAVTGGHASADCGIQVITN